MTSPERMPEPPTPQAPQALRTYGPETSPARQAPEHLGRSGCPPPETAAYSSITAW